MYPFLRMAKELAVHRNAPPLRTGETHVSRHMCWPWDLDFWLELNNGRTLTLYDLGRIPLARRMGLTRILREKRWGMTVAGTMVRYRRRIQLLHVIEMRSRAIGWDDRFFYLEQSMWRNDGECAGHAVYRMAVTSRDGIVAPRDVAEAMGEHAPSPPLPDWVRSWIETENQRPWPPMQDTLA